MTVTATVTVRAAGPADVGAVLRMVHALAAYEGKPEAVQATEETLHAALFGAQANAHALIAEADGRAVGLALWFHNFSTWTGTRGIYLEDLFVEPAARRLGVAAALFRALAGAARATGSRRIDWAVLDWNVDAMAFYRRMGAAPTAGWQPWRLEGAALDALVGEAG